MSWMMTWVQIRSWGWTNTIESLQISFIISSFTGRITWPYVESYVYTHINTLSSVPLFWSGYWHWHWVHRGSIGLSTLLFTLRTPVEILRWDMYTSTPKLSSMLGNVTQELHDGLICFILYMSLIIMNLFVHCSF